MDDEQLSGQTVPGQDDLSFDSEPSHDAVEPSFESDAEPKRGAQAKPEAQQKSSNWQDDPEYRRIQAANDRRFAEVQQQLQEAQQRAQQLESQWEETQTKGMDDYEKANWQAAKYQRELERSRQAMEQMQAQNQQLLQEMAKQKDLAELGVKYGVRVDELMDAQTFREAELKAQILQLRNKEKQENAEVNRADLGGGRASTPTSRKESALDKAFKSGDTRAFVDALLD